MSKVLAFGDKWVLSQTGDRMYLTLGSEYGTVEIQAIRFEVLTMLEKVVQEYDNLKAQGSLRSGEIKP